MQCSVGTLNYMLDANYFIPPQCRARLGHLKLMLFLGLQSSKVSAFAKWRRKASLLIKIHDHGISPVSRTIAQTRNTACVLTELENDSSFGVSNYTRNWKKLSTLQMFTGIYRDFAGGFLQYLQGKPCNIYRLQGDCRENL